MSRPQRNLLVAALTLVAAGLMGLGLGLFGDGTDGTQSVARDPGVAPVTRTTPEAPQTDGLVATPSPSRADAAATSFASLEVRVVDPRGAPLPEAIIRAASPALGNALEARGRALWKELEPGAWRLEITHADYPTHRTGVLLTSGKSLRHIVQLDTQLPLRGRVIDRFGRPRAATRVWFLAPGERHPHGGPAGTPPLVSPAADSPLGTACDRRGFFAVDLPTAGPWRVSLGPPGSVLAAMQRPRELHHGGPSELEVVLGDTTWLEVVCTGGATESVYVRIARRADLRDSESLNSARRLLPSGLPGEAGEARGATGDPDDELVGDLRRQPAAADPSPWTTFAGRQLVAGRVIFDRLPAHEELHFTVQHGELLHEAASSFSLRPDQRARIEFELGLEPLEPHEQDERDERNAQGSALPLAIRFHSTPLQNDQLPAGFHWHE